MNRFVLGGYFLVLGVLVLLAPKWSIRQMQDVVYFRKVQ